MASHIVPNRPVIVTVHLPPDPDEETYMIRLRACSLAIVLGLAACHSPSPARAKAVAPKTFDTPEAAITHYVTSVAAGDLDVALEATAAEEMSARYDFPAVARYVPAMDPLNLQAPTRYEMYVRLNKMILTAQGAAATKMFVYALLADMNLEQPVMSATEAQISRFVTAVDPARLKALKVVRVDKTKEARNEKPELAALNKKHAAFNGADDQTERLALYQLGDRYYWSGFQLLRYGNRWAISGFNSLMTRMKGVGVEKTTPADYDALLKG
ncbi:MAG TPA: hypothetical protein VIQ54_11735 [Polyangia bacterium]